MILCVCRDDLRGTWEVGRRSLGAHPDVFRHVHLVFAAELPMLGETEDLYVIAHGATDGDDGRPMIGDAHDALYLDASTFWGNVRTIIPAGYRGSVYISACESTDSGPGKDFDFAELFAACVKSGRSAPCRVYGHKGGVGEMIPLPDEGLWIEADIA